MGLVLAVVYEHFDGLVPAIWLHVCANLTSIALTALSGRYSSFLEEYSMRLQALPFRTAGMGLPSDDL